MCHSTVVAVLQKSFGGINRDIMNGNCPLYRKSSLHVNENRDKKNCRRSGNVCVRNFCMVNFHGEKFS